MKGVPGLLIAVGLGIVGAFCNWMYLAQMGKDMQTVDFIGIAEDVKINAGDKFNEAHFMTISIPGNAVGNLDKVGRLSGKTWRPSSASRRRRATARRDSAAADLRTPPEMDIKRLARGRRTGAVDPGRYADLRPVPGECRRQRLLYRSPRGRYVSDAGRRRKRREEPRP